MANSLSDLLDAQKVDLRTDTELSRIFRAQPVRTAVVQNAEDTIRLGQRIHFGAWRHDRSTARRTEHQQDAGTGRGAGGLNCRGSGEQGVRREASDPVPLLQNDFGSEQVPIYTVTQPSRQRRPKIRACIDYWADWLQGMAV